MAADGGLEWTLVTRGVALDGFVPCFGLTLAGYIEDWRTVCLVRSGGYCSRAHPGHGIHTPSAEWRAGNLVDPSSSYQTDSPLFPHMFVSKSVFGDVEAKVGNLQLSIGL